MHFYLSSPERLNLVRAGRKRKVEALLLVLLAPACLFAGGPRRVAGVSFFDPEVVGQPVHWSGGQVQYYVDQGPLNSFVSNQQATAMVDAAAALWSAVITAGVTLVNAGALNEDVSGASIVAANGAIEQPIDVAPMATEYPVGVIYDADGSVINAIFGAGANDATGCQNDGVWTWIDNINPDATIAHGVILLNGLCANTAGQIEMMSFQLERAFGLILGLDFSQVNPNALTSSDPNQELGMAVMQPLSGASATLGCGQSTCMVPSTGDGIASVTVSAVGTPPAIVTASLTNGASLQAHFTGGTPPTLSALTPLIFVAAGANRELDRRSTGAQ
ncbi:MAG: hypothetical protein ACLPH3_12365 [Terracidiphilus sp.]